MKKRRCITISLLFLALCLIVLLVWYYTPIHIVETFEMTNIDDAQTKQCTVDLTIERRIIKRAKFDGTFYLGQQLYTIIGAEDGSGGTGLAQYGQSLRGYYMAYVRLARKGELGSLWGADWSELVDIMLCISGWNNAVDTLVVLDHSDGSMWTNIPPAELF